MKRESFLVEAVSGKWLRLPSSFRKSSCVVDLPNGIALNIDLRSGCIEIYAKSEDQVYQFSGEMYLEADRKTLLNSAKIIYRNPAQALEGFS